MRKVVALIAILVLTAANLASQEVLTLKLGGETFIREMPDNLEDSQELIRDLVDMVNSGEKYREEEYLISQNEKEEYLKEMNLLRQALDKANSSLDKAGLKTEEVQKEVEKITEKNTRFTAFFSFGPVIKSGFYQGVNLGFMGEYRLFSNLHLGAGLFVEKFDNPDKDFEAGLNLLLGYSFK